MAVCNIASLQAAARPAVRGLSKFRA